MAPTRADLAATAELLRRLLGLVDAGELTADSTHARALVRRMEGAAVAFEEAASLPRKH